jgi:hypothetical protein
MPASCPDPLNTTFLRPEKTDPSSRSLSEPMQPAHSRLAHRDILRHILSFVDRPTLASCLRVHSLFFDIAGSLLYRELNLVELARDLGRVFAGPHTFFGEHLARTGPIPSDLKNRLLQHVRQIIMPVHLCCGDPYFDVATSLMPKLDLLCIMTVFPCAACWSHGCSLLKLSARKLVLQEVGGWRQLERRRAQVEQAESTTIMLHEWSDFFLAGAMNHLESCLGTATERVRILLVHAPFSRGFGQTLASWQKRPHTDRNDILATLRGAIACLRAGVQLYLLTKREGIALYGETPSTQAETIPVTLDDFNDSLRAVALADGVDLPEGARLQSLEECLSASVAREWDCGMAVYLQEETGEARYPTPIVPKLAGKTYSGIVEIILSKLARGGRVRGLEVKG